MRGIFGDVFAWDHADDGDGWPIFALPPAELGIRPDEGPSYESGVRHQLTFVYDDIDATIADLRGKGLEVRGKPEDEGFDAEWRAALTG